MRRSFDLRAGLVVLFLAAVAGLGAVVWRTGYVQALQPLSQAGASDLTVAADRLVTQLSRYREFAVLMSDHPALWARRAGGSREAADAALIEATDRTGTAAAFFLSPEGRVLAASRPGDPRALTDPAVIMRAGQGALGAGLGTLEGERVFVFAAPHFGAAGAVAGALVVAVDLAALEREWRGSLPTVYFTDPDGRVFVTNRSELLYWRQDGASSFVAPDGRRFALGADAVGGLTIRRQQMSPYIPAEALYLTDALPVIGLTGHALIDVTEAKRLAGLQAAVAVALCLFFGALLFLATERRRTLALANQRLEDRVAERTRALSETNAALRREVAEREEAERRLTRAQAELVQAGKLSALGQMSAGISHELNQPLMAIRSYAENGAAFLDRGRPEAAAENLGRISQMAGRMGRIIQNLRAFARQEAAPATEVGLAGIVDATLDLVEPRIRSEGVAVDWVPPNAPVTVIGGEVRLGQVVLNLITNALDAMAESPERRLRIRIDGDDHGHALLTVQDTGPGIAEPERIFDPFYSTKAVGSGEGMGLGLSISYGMIQSFGGKLRGANAAGGGAIFTVELDRAREAA
ncbi:two-component system, NtrC family, C4-dicarboxylate transport sensor histidine kinase DctB [Roseivivax lentus]|uniref:C4-dicarboxylate transport sensor protein DctB n=1 Tax=Roseivivax lentus TaxID=633194 RepID=A0A1N7LBD4_9RHOB|nr:ATP-binding protein [Roseivivax lentus]SIS71091.1 two-component system, NtrC family, C4-dicarboxylate transport sensor histidine kinase DctB [Roseivivax lentus]